MCVGGCTFAVGGGRRLRRGDGRRGRLQHGRGAAQEVVLVDAVAQAVGDAAHDGAPDLGRGHLAQLLRRRVRVERGVRRAQHVRRVLQRALLERLITHF